MSQSSTDAPEAEDDTPHPVDVLIRVVVTLLTPMFLAGANGDAAFASMAALETIRSYRAQNHATLVKVANVIAFGLATLGSLSLSMTDDLPIPLILKLRSNATALDRSAERNERAIALAHPAAQPTAAATLAAAPGAAAPGADAPWADAPRPASPAPPRQEFDEAAVLASVAEASQRAAEFRAGTQAPRPAAAQATSPVRPAAAASPAPHRSQWAAAMAEVAAEEMAAIHRLPTSLRKQATVRAAILSSTANSLLSGTPVDYMTTVRPTGTPAAAK